MKKVIDNFSIQSSTYKKFRPEYPNELYQLILSYCEGRSACWDCGTGNGQVAKVLSNDFDKVYATDISRNQIELAAARSNIEYSVSRSEETRFKEDTFDLITVAQAIHWFDFESFYREVRRVGKPNSRLCVWGYGLLSIDKKVDEVIGNFYNNIIGPYWNKERGHVDSNYETIDFNFEHIPMPTTIEIKVDWSFENLIGYLNSWSSVQNYIKINDGVNPVDRVGVELSKCWKHDEFKKVVFPIFIKMGIVKK